MKKRWRIQLAILLAWLAAQRSEAQTDAQFNQYADAIGYYNPATAGKAENLNVFALFNAQWIGMGGNPPITVFVTADMPWNYKKTKHGLGIVAYNEIIGLEQNLFAALQYAYKLKIGKGILSLGLQAGLVSMAFDGEKIFIPESEEHETPENDEAMTTAAADGMGFDMNAGAYFQINRLYTGFGVTHVTAPTINLDENMERKITRGYNFIAAYNIQTRHPLLEVQPSVFIQLNSQMLSGDVTVNALYNKLYSAGVGTRLSDNGKMSAVILYLGMKWKNIRAGYAFELPTSAIVKASAGSHELALSYQLKLNKTKAAGNKHKSVRYL
jgi:type IX secretion system PorP/SprF family membrane protein